MSGGGGSGCGGGEEREGGGQGWWRVRDGTWWEKEMRAEQTKLQTKFEGGNGRRGHGQ